jgi:hypothetical protein
LRSKKIWEFVRVKGHPGYTILVQRRIFQLQRSVQLNTQQLRVRTINRLENLFTLATSIAKGEVKFQSVNGKEEPISWKQRQMWAHVAAHVAMVMANLAKGYDERQFNEDLAKLEQLVDEIKKAQSVERRNQGNQAVQGAAKPARDSSKAYTA